MVYTCFVHNCPVGRKSCKEKVSTFKCPNDEYMLHKWRDVVPQKYRMLTKNDRICEKHFESKFVIPRYQQVKGDFYQDFIRPRLSHNAIPTIFPGLENFNRKQIIANIKTMVTKKVDVPKTDEPETLTSLIVKEISKGIEVSDKEYIFVCFNCLNGKCFSHTILVE